MSTTTTSADRIVRRRVAVEFLGQEMSMEDAALVSRASRVLHYDARAPRVLTSYDSVVVAKVERSEGIA